jgi:hypothetical protein
VALVASAHDRQVDAHAVPLGPAGRIHGRVLASRDPSVLGDRARTHDALDAHRIERSLLAGPKEPSDAP